MTGRRLTVLQILPELDVGGVERGTLQVAAALVAAGHRALVVSGGGRLEAELHACGAEHLRLPVGVKHLRSLRLVPALRRLFAQHSVDIVHARSRLPAWLAWLALGGPRRAPRPAWVTSVHGPYSVNRYSRIMVSGDAIIAISAFIRDYVLGAYPDVAPARIELIPRGVERDRYHPGYVPGADWSAAFHAAHPALAGRRLLTLPARLTRWKGQRDFIEVIARLRADGLPVHGLLAGAAHRRKRAYAEELRRLVEARGLAADVSFLGERQDLREILAVSDLVFSLTHEPEAFGRTTLEALSLGTPVIGYAHGGTAEILGALYPAGLVASGDVAGAAARAGALLASPAPVPLEHPYTVERMTGATLALYRRLAG
jgi:glycosyltransferase involved in cell wall biosynthesis